MRVLTDLIVLCASIPAFAFLEQAAQDQIGQRIQQLQQTLLRRESPESLFVPTLNEQSRKDQIDKAMRPYVALQFDYKMADLRLLGNSAELPVRVHWRTPNSDGTLSGTMRLVRVENQWYFRSLDFLIFPWGQVIWASLVAIAFAVGIFWLAYKLKNRKDRAPERV